MIAALLGVAAGQRYPPLELTPERQKRRTFEALLDQLVGLPSGQPVLAVYEDVHWGDPTTLELLGMMVDRIEHLPVLVMMTFRPGFSTPWTGHPHVSSLTSAGSAPRRCAHGRAPGRDKALPDEVLEQILAKTDGVPLFVEELTRTVLEFGPAQGRGRPL